LFIGIVRIQEEGKVPHNVFFVKVDGVLHDTFIEGFNVKQVKLGGTVVVTAYINVIHAGQDSHTAKVDGVADVSLVEPAVFRNPRIRCFFLFVPVKYLFEETVVVIKTDTVAVQAESCNGIKEAGSKTAKTTVTKGRF